MLQIVMESSWISTTTKDQESVKILGAVISFTKVFRGNILLPKVEYKVRKEFLTYSEIVYSIINHILNVIGRS
jgi:hypothetical protein